MDRGPKTPLINNKTVMDGSPEQCAAGKKGNRKMMGGPPVYQDFGDILGVMPIFGRRQLQRMLDELGPWLTVGKAKDLLKRLDSREPNQALPAEYELGITWAVSKIAMLEIDRSMGNRTPDIYSPDLLKGGPLFADVAAIDDVSPASQRCGWLATLSIALAVKSARGAPSIFIIGSERNLGTRLLQRQRGSQSAIDAASCREVL